jgi:hypothetical protein
VLSINRRENVNDQAESYSGSKDLGMFKSRTTHLINIIPRYWSSSLNIMGSGSTNNLIDVFWW